MEIKILDIIGTPNAVLRSTAQDFYIEIESSSNKNIILNFEGIENLSSGFCNASIGKIVMKYPEIKNNISIINLNDEILKRKVDSAINFEANSSINTQIDDLFK